MDTIFESVLGHSAPVDSNDAPQAAAVGVLPADFVFAMRETAYYTLQDWLEAAGAPAEVLSLLSSLYTLGTPEVADADAVAQAAQAAAALGCGFDGPATRGISHVKEHARAWLA